MSGSRRSAVSRSGAGDHTGSYANLHRRRNQVLSERRLRANNRRNQLHEMTVTDVDNRTHSAGQNAALTIPSFPSSSSLPGPSTPSKFVTNLGSFLRSVMPIVPAKKLPETNAGKEAEIRPYFFLGDLWETFEEWSAYGAGVPFLLKGTHPITQYYVPYLSGMQVYTDPKKPPTTIGVLVGEKDVNSHEPDQQTDLVSDGSFASLNVNQKLKQVALSDNKTEVCGSNVKPAFEFLELEQPYTRKPLSVQAAVLGSLFPELSKYRSCDLLPSSWICVAWYPIYRIPVGPTQEDLEACFLTLHSLSTQPGSFSKPMFSNSSVNGEIDLSPKVHLPAIGLVSYKLKGSIISPRDPYEREQEHALLAAASKWLNNIKAFLPDYHFFVNRYSP